MTSEPRRCVCPGPYDPVTNGHVDIIGRAAGLFDEVVVAVLHNQAKQGTFSVDERLELLKQSLAHLDNVRIAAWADRLVATMVKGLRGGTDFAYELPMAHMNRHLTGVETLFLSSAPDLQHVSSSLIKEVVRYGGDVSGLVPDVVLTALEERMR